MTAHQHSSVAATKTFVIKNTYGIPLPHQRLDVSNLKFVKFPLFKFINKVFQYLAVAVIPLPRTGSKSSIVVFIMVPVACTLIFMTAWLFHRRVFKKPLPGSQTALSDEENILLDKSENIHGERSLLYIYKL